MAKSYFLMKAQQHDYQKHFHRGNWWSVKLDGMRALWDGGITRGETEVPWLRGTGKVATGLWSMSGKIIYAPDWWLDQLPKNVVCDGELWAGVGQFQKTMSICRSHDAGDRWHDIKFMCYDTPTVGQVFIFRNIDEPRLKLSISMMDSMFFKLRSNAAGMEWYSGKGWTPPFNWGLEETEYFTLLEHARVMGDTPEEQEIYLSGVLDSVLEHGHEGIMIRKQGSIWRPIRSHDLTKIKPFSDEEATVIGVQFGKRTELGSKYLGKMGSLICEWEGKKIKVSGFKTHERHLTMSEEAQVATAEQMGIYTEGLDPYEFAEEYAKDHEGEEYIGDAFQCIEFPVGSTITFKYRELTDGGMPKDPRYWRDRPDE